MLRHYDTRTLQWADKTMSVMRADQLEACEKDLTGLPSRCLFEPECSNIDAEKLYELSFFADEDRCIQLNSCATVCSIRSSRNARSFLWKSMICWSGRCCSAAGSP